MLNILDHFHGLIRYSSSEGTPCFKIQKKQNVKINLLISPQYLHKIYIIIIIKLRMHFSITINPLLKLSS